MIDHFTYDDFISRNNKYIEQDVQHKIKKSKIVFFGAGLSSNIAEYCTRLGFQHIYLNDGDKIELSNLNRQLFNFDDIGKYKAEVLKERILKINPSCHVYSNNTYINTQDDFIEQIDNSDIVINTVDCNQTYFDIIEYARSKNKLVICPFNPGFGGFILCFNQHSAPSHETFDLSGELNDIEIARQLFEKYPEMMTLREAKSTADEFLLNASSCYFPQIGIGALITTALTLTTMVNFLAGETITLAPNILYKTPY